MIILFQLSLFKIRFMFQVTKDEMEHWKSQIVISNFEKMGLRRPPRVFTEQGIAQLSSVLNSERAIGVNIQIIRIFTKMRSLIESHQEILLKLEKDEKIRMIFKFLKMLERSKANEQKLISRNPIG